MILRYRIHDHDQLFLFDAGDAELVPFRAQRKRHRLCEPQTCHYIPHRLGDSRLRHEGTGGLGH
ncbi:hypothetical protein SDC9_193247 [bioreactor metagenome]|uniref:Uncharacterized protein n=1 Tax=bioreactor metagenome TaxID=1076179 RepID=A0A645I352_9ZZZZ